MAQIVEADIFQVVSFDKSAPFSCQGFRAEGCAVFLTDKATMKPQVQFAALLLHYERIYFFLRTPMYKQLKGRPLYLMNISDYIIFYSHRGAYENISH